MIKRMLALTLLPLLAVIANANTITVYNVTIDTSSVSTLTGAIYFQFSPGLNADPATASISLFSIGAPGSLLSVPAVVTDGDVTGILDSLPLIIGNTSGLNDYLNFLVFGNTIDFTVNISHPVTLTGDAGSAFLFGLTSDDGLSPILTQDPSGMLGQIAFDQTGAFTVDQLSDFATVTPTAVPEPSTRTLLSASFGILALFGIARRVRFSA